MMEESELAFVDVNGVTYFVYPRRLLLVGAPG